MFYYRYRTQRSPTGARKRPVITNPGIQPFIISQTNYFYLKWRANILEKNKDEISFVCDKSCANTKGINGRKNLIEIPISFREINMLRVCRQIKLN